MEKEIRQINISLETRANEETKDKFIEGYIAKYNSRSQYMGFYEEIKKGAFDNTISDGHNITALFNHDYNQLLGSTDNKTLILTTDDIGLRFSLKVNENISYFRDIFELIKSGECRGCSFGFKCNKDAWSYDEAGIDLRYLYEIDISEVTLTPYPVYKDSEVSCRSFLDHKNELKIKKDKERLKVELEII